MRTSYTPVGRFGNRVHAVAVGDCLVRNSGGAFGGRHMRAAYNRLMRVGDDAVDRSGGHLSLQGRTALLSAALRTVAIAHTSARFIHTLPRFPKTFTRPELAMQSDRAGGKSQ
jgi:hypothetical protein